MHIYLTQHGLAVPKDVDSDRPLNEQGREGVQRLAELLRGTGDGYFNGLRSPIWPRSGRVR